MSRNRKIGTCFGAALAGVLALLLIACGEKKDPVFEDPLDDLYFEEQAKAAAHEFLAIAKANASKSCKRPVLRGTPLPGKAAEDIIAVVEPTGDDDPCVAALDDTRWPAMRNSYFIIGGAPKDDFPPRKLWPVRPFDGDAKREPIDAMRSACSKELAQMEKAVAHEEACSPYLPGVRHVESYKKYVRLSSLTAVSAIERARAGETREATESLLDAIRFSQDFHRGGTSYIEPMLAGFGSREAITSLEWILNRPEPVGAPLLAQIDQELSALAASEPHPRDFVLGNTVDIAISDALLAMIGPQWSPPGTWLGERDEVDLYDPYLGQVLVVVQHRKMTADSQACSPDDRAAACYDSLVSMGHRLARDVAVSDVKNPLWWMAPPWDRRFRDKNARIGLAIEVPAYINYVKKHGQTLFYLGALRLLAKYRALAEETQSCPEIEAFDRPDLADARIDPYSGKKLRIERIGAGRFVVKSSEKLELGDEPEDSIEIHVRCPFLAQKKPPVGGV